DMMEYETYKQDIRSIRSTTEYRTVSEAIRRANSYERKKLEPSLPRELVKDFRNAKSVYKYPTLKIMGESLGRLLMSMRIQLLIDMIPHLDFIQLIESTVKKTVFFTSYIEVLNVMERLCINEGLTPILVYGKNSSHVDSLVKQFGKDDQIKPLIA